MNNGMLSNLWYESLVNSLDESFERRILEHYRKFRKPAITQTLTYEVEQSVSPWSKLEYRDFAFTGVTWL